MRYSQAKQGRIFILRLEDGDTVHNVIEQFAVEKGIKAASLIVLGGADESSRLIVGPVKGRAAPVRTLEKTLPEVHEVMGVGTLFPDDKTGKPLLHMHLACGRDNDTLTGCIRQGVKVWHIMEVVLYELLESTAKRVADPALGFKLLQP